jgi:hypothetical protein
MSNLESMREKHRRDSMVGLSCFLGLLLVFILHTHYTRAFCDLVRNPATLAEVQAKSWLVLALTFIAPFASYVLGILTISKRDLYYTVDNLVFRRRKKVDLFICQSILDFKIPLSDQDKQAIQRLRLLLDRDEKVRQIMAIFYRYIEKPDIVNPTLKQNAFTYWGDYFSSMMLVCWGTLALVGAGVITALDGSLSPLRVAIAAAMGIVVAVNLAGLFWGTTVRKQFEIPKTQISEMHRNAAEPILKEFRAEGFFLDGE